MITLRDAALLFGANERTILYWAKQNNITLTKVGESWMVDDVAISKLFAHNIRWGKEYMKEEISIREEALTNAILQIDDLIYLFKSVKRIAPIFRLIIQEMSQLIPHEQKKAVFLEVISGTGISEVAKNHGISFARACYLYESSLTIIRSHQGFFSNYLNILADKETQINRLQIQNNNLKQHITTIHAVLEKERIKDTNEQLTGMAEENIPWTVVKLLSLNLLTELNLDTRNINCLRVLDIVTVEDLLRFIKKGGGLNSLFMVRNFGVKSCKALVHELENIGIFDSEGNSGLFKYIE